MNNDTEFLAAAEAELIALENWLEDSDADLDCLRSGNVLTIELGNGSEIVVNIQTPMHEIWCASRMGGFHFSYNDGGWKENHSERSLEQAISDALANYGVDVSKAS